MSRSSLTVCSFPSSVGRGEAAGETGCDCGCPLLPTPRAGHPGSAVHRWADGAEVMSNVTALAAAGVWDTNVAPSGLREEPWQPDGTRCCKLVSKTTPKKAPSLLGVLASQNTTVLGQCYLSPFAVSMCSSLWFLLVLVVAAFSSPCPAGFHALQQSCSSLPEADSHFLCPSLLHFLHPLHSFPRWVLLCQGFLGHWHICLLNSSTDFISYSFLLFTLLLVWQHFVLLVLSWDIFLLLYLFAPGFIPLHSLSSAESVDFGKSH